MAHELCDAIGERLKNRDQIDGGEITRQDEAGEVICTPHPVPRQYTGEMAVHAAHRERGETCADRYGPSVKGQIEGTAEKADFVLLGHPGGGVENGGKQVRVLVRVQVRGSETGGKNFFSLGPKLIKNVPSTGKKPRHQGRQSRGQRAAWTREAGTLDHL